MIYMNLYEQKAQKTRKKRKSFFMKIKEKKPKND